MVLMLVLAFMFGALAPIPTASAQIFDPIVVTFDDQLVDHAQLPADYAGLSWSSNWYCIAMDTSPYYQPHSSPTRVYSVGSVASISFGMLVSFQGAWFSGSTPYSPQVQFKGYRNNELVATSAWSPGITGDPYFLDVDFIDVDKVEVISSETNNHWCMDDFTYTPNIELNLAMSIDPVPGSTTNAVNLAKKGTTAVAIISDSTVDANWVDPTTITLGQSLNPVVITPVSYKMIDIAKKDKKMEWVFYFSNSDLATVFSATGSQEFYLKGRTLVTADPYSDFGIMGDGTINVTKLP